MIRALRAVRPARFVIRSYVVDEDSAHRRFWKFRIVAQNGRKLDPRQPYNSRASVVKVIRAIMEAKEIVER